MHACGIIDLLHKACRIDRATVECSIEDILKVNAELIGQGLTVGTAKIGVSYTDHEAAVRARNAPKINSQFPANI